MRRLALAGLMLSAAACSSEPENGELAVTEARQAREAAGDGRIDCALEGAKLFDRTCTIDEMSDAEGTVLVVGRSDTGFRRLQITGDGRGVVSADGAEAASVTIVGNGLIEVAVGNDRYRLPANTGGAS